MRGKEKHGWDQCMDEKKMLGFIQEEMRVVKVSRLLIKRLDDGN